MSMTSCPFCEELSASPCRCDHCGATLKSCKTMRSAAAVALGLALTGCPPVGQVQPDYGVGDTGIFDDDGDGYNERDGDCDDGDDTIHPDATETPGDGIDSNCDGDDDT
ncbi:MAG: hypothetical protein H6737_03165 [Alphaproteobacteria bacterium]|nr:hypothetical protein [Alphaproteobacteria bacterium]